MNDIIRLENVDKYYEAQYVLKKVGLNIPKGAIYGLLGPNGAGKTTTIRIINGVADLTSGNVYFNDNIVNSKSAELNLKSGVLTETASCYEYLTAVQNLRFFGQLYGIDKNIIEERIDELLKILKLEDSRNKKVKKFSTGMRKRINLARALIHDPEILFLDEPTSGLDPDTAEIVNVYIKELVEKKGKTVILCTHQLEYAQQVCTHYGFIDDGRIICEGTYEQISRNLRIPIRLKLRLSKIPSWLKVDEKNGDFVWVIIENDGDSAKIIAKLIEENVEIYHAEQCRKQLKEIYFDLINGGKK